MRIIAKSTLRAFWERHPNAEEPLLAWYRETEKADWDSPAQVKAQYRSASFVGENRVIFNIKGNDYRLVVKINYPYRVVYVRFVGTHAEYDKIDVGEVQHAQHSSDPHRGRLSRCTRPHRCTYGR